MATTYTLISSNVLSSSAASVTFSSIPSTYTDLVIRCSARSSFAADFLTELRVEFNASAGTAYSVIYLYGGDSTASTGIASSAAYSAIGFNETDAQTASTFSSQEIYIPNYAGSTNKPISGFGVSERNNTDGAYVVAGAGLWRDTSAITSIKLTNSSGNFVSGSSFYLYGIKNS